MPRTLNEYLRMQSTFENMISIIISKGCFETGIKTFDEFDNIFNDRKNNTSDCNLSSKLQGIFVAYNISMLKKKSLDSLIHKWGYLLSLKVKCIPLSSRFISPQTLLY